jgi:hypothetical protein
MKKFISAIACVAAALLAAGIALPSASADPTNDPGPTPTVTNQPNQGDELEGSYHWGPGTEISVNHPD